jgi:hypothetical protein
MLTSDIGNLLDNSAMQLGDMVAEFSAASEGLLSAAIAAATPENDRRQLRQAVYWAVPSKMTPVEALHQHSAPTGSNGSAAQSSCGSPGMKHSVA